MEPPEAPEAPTPALYSPTRAQLDTIQTSSPVFAHDEPADEGVPSAAYVSGMSEGAPLEPEPAPAPSDEEDGDNEPPVPPVPPTGLVGLAGRLGLEAPPPPAPMGTPPRMDMDWFCHACARRLPAPNDPANPQCGSCGEYFVELVPAILPAGPPPGSPPRGRGRPEGLPRSPIAATRGRAGNPFADADDDEDYANGGGGGGSMAARLAAAGAPPRGPSPPGRLGGRGGQPLTEDERMERLLVAVRSPPFRTSRFFRSAFLEMLQPRAPPVPLTRVRRVGLSADRRLRGSSPSPRRW